MHPKNWTSWVRREREEDFSKPANQSGSQGSYSLSDDDHLSIQEALDHMRVVDKYRRTDSCSVCKKITSKTCPKCGTFYCSSECQIQDWPRHKDSCAKPRSWTKRLLCSEQSRRNKAKPSRKPTDEVMMMAERSSSPFIALANQLQRQSLSDNEGACSSGSIKEGNRRFAEMGEPSGTQRAETTFTNHGAVEKRTKQPLKKGFFSKKSRAEETRKTGATAINEEAPETTAQLADAGVTAKPGPAPKSKATPNGGAVRKAGTTVKSHPDGSRDVLSDAFEAIWEKVSGVRPAPSTSKAALEAEVPKSKNLKVLGTQQAGPDRYWVIELSDLDKYKQIQEALNGDDDDHTLVNPKLGIICSCSFSDEWVRGKIIAMSPTITILLIDLGVTITSDQGIFRKLPVEYQTLPPLAFLIELDQNVPEEYRTSNLVSLEFGIEEIRILPDGIPVVTIVEEPVPSNRMEKDGRIRNKNSVTKSRKRAETAGDESNWVMNLFEPGSSGKAFLSGGEGKTRYASLVPNNSKEADRDLKQLFLFDVSTKDTIQPREGEYVLLPQSDGGAQRGKVVACFGSSCYVTLIDSGMMVTANKVYPMPEIFKGIIEVGVKITLEEVFLPHEMKTLDTLNVTLMGEDENGIWPCELTTATNNKVATASIERPPIKLDWQPTYVDLKSGSVVELSTSIPPNLFYVRPVDVETEQKFLELNMEMIQHTPQVQSFTDIPPLGEMLCAQFAEDGQFYRAVVNDVKGNKVKVFFVDFGNEQETDPRLIKPLRPDLKALPFFAVQVRLSNVTPKPWNNAVKQYITNLTNDCTELLLSYTTSLTEGVTLTEKNTGLVVNGVIETRREESSRRCETIQPDTTFSRCTVFTEEHIERAVLTPGTRCDLVVLHVNDYEFEDNYIFWATVARSKNFDYVNSVLSYLMNEHCAKPEAPHEPKERELCLAQFEGSWYRGLCTKIERGMFKIFFFDFGNSSRVNSTSIQKMPAKFVKAPALAMKCTIRNWRSLMNNERLTKRVKEFLQSKMNNLIHGALVEEPAEQGNLQVLTIPEIEDMIFG